MCGYWDEGLVIRIQLAIPIPLLHSTCSFYGICYYCSGQHLATLRGRNP